MEQHFPAAADFIPMDSTGGSDAGFCISRQGVVPALIDQTSLEKYINNVLPDLLK